MASRVASEAEALEALAGADSQAAAFPEAEDFQAEAAALAAEDPGEAFS